MNKTIEALELAEALENDAKEHREVSYGLDCPPERTANWKHALNCEAAARLIREALAEPVCEHRIADARNEFVRDGYICIKCGALFRAADHAEPVKQEHESREDIAAKEMFEGFSKAWAAPVKQELNWGANKFMPHEQAVKQELVAWHHPECEGECLACLIERCVKDSYGKQGLDYMLRHINAAPVSAEAIRAEALEEVVKFLSESGLITPTGRFAAPIRGMK